MDTDHVQHLFNTKLVKFLGLYYVISPNTSTLYGYNKIHLLSWSFAAVLLGVLIVVMLEICRTIEQNPFNVLLPICVVQNFAFSAFKLIVLTRRSGDIWNCLDAVRVDFLSPGSVVYAVPGLFRRFQSAFAQWSYVLISISISAFCYAIMPFVFHDSRTTWLRPDGTVDSYRLNIFNLIYPVSEDTYNRWFYTFYACELFIAVIFMLICNSLDFVVVPMCLALCFHLETLAQEYRSLGHDVPTANKRDTDDANHTTAVTLDQIKWIISCHGKVIHKMEDFFKIVRRTILIQIAISSSTIVYLFNIVIVYMNSAEYLFQGFVTLTASVYFTFQLLIPCYFFGLLNDTKDSMNFAIYNSNWTQMDIECKKLILLAMNMNNGNDLKMRITPTKVVNMALFKSTIHVCYSILSVMAKADIKNRTII